MSIRKTAPLKVICARYGKAKPAILANKRRDPTFPIFMVGGTWVGDLDALDVWDAKQAKKTIDELQASWTAGIRAKGGGVYEKPTKMLAAEAEFDVRVILRTGKQNEQRPHLRNAARLGGDAPSDIVAALGLGQGAGWARVVDKIEQLLGLPSEKKKLALEFIADRRAEFFSAAADPLADEDAELLA